MSATERFNMEVRDASDPGKLLGWLLVPLDVYRGEDGHSWAFELRHRYGDSHVRHVRLPIGRYKAPGGRDWFAFQATPADMPLLREVVVFASA